MHVTVIFETVEGQTEKIARSVTERVEALGHTTELVDTRRTEQTSFANVDAVILAAPVHQRRHPRTFEAYLEAHKKDIEARRTLMISVSLSAAFPEGLGEANEYLVEMKMRTGLEPDAEALVAGAIRISQYDYFALQVVRHVVLRGHEVDTSADEHEFTDWEALKETVSTFLK